MEYLNNYKDIKVPDQKVVHIFWGFMRQHTVGWQLCVQWRDGSTLYREIKGLKESHPVEKSKYTVSQEIYHELAFNWWVRAVLKKSLIIKSLCQEEECLLPQEDSQVWNRGV